MIDIEKLVQVKAFARMYALLLTLLWTVSFLTNIYMPSSILGNMLALSTPFLLVLCVCTFRDRVLDGSISFRRAYAFCAYTCLYASLLFALLQFAYLSFVHDSAFCTLIDEAMAQMKLIYEQSGMEQADIEESISIISNMTPIQWALVFMLQNILTGAVTSLIAAAFGRKKRVSA